MAKHISHGADVEQLDDIAVGLRRQGEKIADVGGRGASLLEKLRALWDGPDFEKFAGDWRAAHRTIDDAESAMRTYSRKLVNEAESQRQSSGLSAHGVDTSGGPRIVSRGGGGGDAGEPGGEGPGGPGAGGQAFERTDGASHERPASAGGQAFERVEDMDQKQWREGEAGGAAFERVDQGEWQAAPGGGEVQHGGPRTGPSAGVQHFAPVTSLPTISVAPLPDGGAGLVLQIPGWPPIQVPLPSFPFVADTMVPVLPDLPGAETIDLDRLDPPAFERLDQPAYERVDGAGEPQILDTFVRDAGPPVADQAFLRDDMAGGPGPETETPTGVPSETPTPASPDREAAPTQVPTGDGAHVSTASDSVGQRSVAFDPMTAALGSGASADGSQMGGWLGIGDLDLLPWNS